MAAALNRYNDIFLAGLVVSIIALMILPLPSFLVDTLLATNLCIAVALLLVALYIPSPLALSTFPSLLLFTTLFRLALNITTTRQILLHAYGGKIIQTFGEMVVGGNLIVGVVVFLIITIVQFVVIAKGSERVAEVGARFTLDAMPGKQMSIDADLRSGSIDIAEAKKRRLNIEKESQMYGAMDGAMKFVKGDAIAGLIITVINILGGLAVGCLQKDMTAGGALSKYSVLTIGDGLVSQIPALFISITAGIVVTRVSTGDQPHIGGEIGQQLLSRSKPLIIAGVMLLLMALIPGFPKPQFFLLALILLGVGFIIHMQQKTATTDQVQDKVPALSGAIDQKDGSKGAEAEDFSITVPLMLDVDKSIERYIKPKALNGQLLNIRRALYKDLGVPFPGIHLNYSSQSNEGEYGIYMHEVPIARGRLNRGYLLVREDPDNLEMLGMPFTVGKPFLPDIETVWVEDQLQEKLEQNGIVFMDMTKILTYHLSHVLKHHSSDFIGLQETRYLLSRMEEKFPEIVKELQRVLSVQKICEVLQRLVMEEVSIRNLRVIFQSLIEWGQKEKDTILLTEYVRMGLTRYISYKYGGKFNTLPVYLLDPAVEEMVRESVRQTSAGSYLALNPESANQLLETIKESVGEYNTAGRTTPVLLTSMDIRRYLKKLIESELPGLPVLSHQELSPDINIQPLDKIALNI
ncbi:MAG: EscV/YscV/HrcV family type III secretion system export apparatus protein [Desulfobacteraceae bacterium]|nr:EscV/YscV/HrcV family type III secretion system export apparatus protein [Desulfobacteraceae bacterium]